MNRMVLANTEELHERIETLCIRIRLLEDALRTLQASVSTHPHPLLSNGLLLPPLPSDTRPVGESSPQQPLDIDEEETLLDAFGMSVCIDRCPTSLTSV